MAVGTVSAGLSVGGSVARCSLYIQCACADLAASAHGSSAASTAFFIYIVPITHSVYTSGIHDTS